MKKYLEILKKSPLFHEIEEKEILGMLQCLGAKVQRTAKNQPIFLEGDSVEYVGIVLSGLVQIVREDYFGNRSMIAVVEPAEMFGEAFACAFHQQLVRNLLGIVATKNLLLNQKLEVMSKKTTKEKIMAYLMLQAKKNNSNSFTIPYDRQALADYLGVERSAMSVEIGKLKKEGAIECSRSFFKLLL